MRVQYEQFELVCQHLRDDMAEALLGICDSNPLKFLGCSRESLGHCHNVSPNSSNYRPRNRHDRQPNLVVRPTEKSDRLNKRMEGVVKSETTGKAAKSECGLGSSKE